MGRARTRPPWPRCSRGRHSGGTSPARCATTTPTAVGSAFDLSSGPTALLVVLAGTALLLVAGSGMRVWRTRRRV